MSVLIKGMQMPKNCAECPVALSGKYCRINKTCETFKALPIRPDHCPIVELPERHGRLFDQDDVKAVLYDMPDTEDKWDAITLLEWAIDKRWCIEAEGVDE